VPVFDSIASSYDSWYESKMGSFVDRVETDLALELFKVKQGMHVLDIGCGTGNFSIKLAGMGCRVTGIDISDEMLEIARKKVKEQNLDIRFFNMDTYKLQFDNEYFDAAFSMAAFEFIKEPEKAIDEIFRVVKKGGQVLIGTINKNSSWGRLYLSDEYQKKTIFKYSDFKTPEDMKSWKPEKLAAFGQCLFIPPDAGEEEICMERENALSNSEEGGFICALWIR